MFAHVLLYVMSTVILRAEMKILVINKDDEDTNVMSIVVFKEVFYNLFLFFWFIDEMANPL